MRAACPLDSRTVLCVRDVCRVPGEQIVDAMAGCRRDVERICGGLLRQPGRLDEAVSESDSRRGDIEQWQIRENSRSARRGLRISGTHLIEDELRYEDLELRPAPMPPLVSDLLARGRDQIAARPRGEVADH